MKDVSKLKVIPLGGLGEIGKNITAIEYENDITKILKKIQICLQVIIIII